MFDDFDLEEDTIEIIEDSPTVNESKEEDTVENPLKVAKLAIIIGFILILIVGIGSRFIGKKNKQEPQQAVQETNQAVQETNQAVQETNQAVQGTPTRISNNLNNWIEFNGDTTYTYDTEVDSSFTVISIKHYVKALDSDVYATKSIVTGNISGLSGEFEIELPYYKACKLNKHNTFNISYKYYINETGKTVVGDIIVE